MKEEGRYFGPTTLFNALCHSLLDVSIGKQPDASFYYNSFSYFIRTPSSNGEAFWLICVERILSEYLHKIQKWKKNQLHLCIDNVYDFISTHHDTRFYEKLSIKISWYFYLSWARHVKILSTTTPQVDRKCHISLIKIKKFGLMVYIYLLSIDFKPKTFPWVNPVYQKVS